MKRIFFLCLLTGVTLIGCSTTSTVVRDVASAGDGKDQCISRAADFVDPGTTSAQINQLCAGSPVAAPNSPLVCFQRSADFTGATMTINQKINLCAGAPQSATVPLECLASLIQFEESATLDQEVAACSFSSGQSESKLTCLGRSHDFVDEDTTLGDEITLCTGAPASSPTSPLVCFEKAVDFTGVKMTSAQKAVLCASAPTNQNAPLECMESLSKSGEKASVDDEASACSMSSTSSEADLQCLGRAHDFVDQSVTLTQKKQLCTNAPAAAPNTPLICYGRAEDLAGKTLSVQGKIDFCLKQKN